MNENGEDQDVIFSIPPVSGDEEGKDESTIPVVETNADHEITSCNPAALSFFDLESADMLGSRFEQIVLVSDCINDDCIFRQAIEKAQPASTKAVVKTREKAIPVHYAVIPVVNQEKNVNAVMHYFFERSDETMLAEEVSYVTHAFISGDFSVRGSMEHFSSEEKKVLTSLNTLIDSFTSVFSIIDTSVRNVADGILSKGQKDTFPGDFQNVFTSLEMLSDMARTRNDEIESVVTSVTNGDVHVRLDPGRYTGANRELTEGINNLMDAYSRPLQVSTEYIDRISNGDIPPLVTDNYSGYFNALKNNLNTLIDVITMRNRDIRMLINAAAQGELSVRADAGKYSGANGEMILGLNSMIDAYTKPFLEAAGYIDRISQGDIPPLLAREFFGDFNAIKNNLNNLIGVVNMRNRDIRMLIDAAAKGELSVRADAGKYSGANGEMILGLNSMIDAYTNPILVAARYIDRISQGDIPYRITDNYYGDFNKIKDNLNNLIDVVNMRNRDIRMLIDAATKGDLTIRADADTYSGANGNLIRSINQMLDAIITPLRESIRVLESYAECRFSNRYSDTIPVNGEFLAMKNTVEKIGKQVSETIGEVARVSNRYASGIFSERYRSDLITLGDFIEIRDALNTIGQKVSHALNLVIQDMTVCASCAEETTASIEEIAAGSQHLAQISNTVSEGASTSGYALVQVLSSMQDLSSSVTSVAVSVETISALSQNSDEDSRKGIILAGEVQAGMNHITAATNDVDTIIGDILSEMDGIRKIIQIITDIASQTNLLSLNAAIEAARAGDVGRGFAVVASEVKSLAQESRKSAEHIEAMIQRLQEKTENATVATKTATRFVKEGGSSLESMLGIFTTIASQVQEIYTKITDIAAVTEEQAASVAGISDSIKNVSKQTQEAEKYAVNAASETEQTSAAIQEVSATMEGMSKTIQDITQEMGKFSV